MVSKANYICIQKSPILQASPHKADQKKHMVLSIIQSCGKNSDIYMEKGL